MESQNANNSGGSGLLGKLISFATDPMGMALIGAGALALAVVLYVVIL